MFVWSKSEIELRRRTAASFYEMRVPTSCSSSQPGVCLLRRRQPSFFAFLAGGKRGVTIADGEPLPFDLVASADIVILGATPEEAKAYGLDLDELRRAAPHCVVVKVSDFGWAGPWSELPATEFTLQAWSGSTGSRGDPAQAPIAVGGDLGEFLVGSYAAFFALAAHYGRNPFDIDLSALEVMTITMQVFSWLRKDLMRLEKIYRSIEVPSVERALDGYVGITMATAQQWRDFCAMVGCTDLAEKPEFRFQSGRWEHRDVIRARTAEWFAHRTVAEIVNLAAEYRIPMAAIGNGATIPEMDHVVFRGIFQHHPVGFRQPRTPWLMSAAAPQPPALPPALDDVPPDCPARATTVVPNTELPLQGLRVIDLTAFWAGPGATNLFAALGADVIKIESAQRPDGMRLAGGYRPDVDWWEYSWVFHGVNTGKRSLTLNLDTDSGRAILGKLIAGADVVIENFTPRVMENFGLDESAIRAFKQDIIIARMPGFGLDGPWRDRVGFAMTMEQIGGLAWLTGPVDGLPTPPRGACDPLAGLHAAFAIVAALQYRRRTGQGQLIEVPMIDVVLNASARQVIDYDTTGKVLTRNGNRGHEFSVQNVFACAGDDQWIAISIRDDRDWQNLVQALGNPAWAADSRFARESFRREHIDTIEAQLADWFATKALDTAVQTLLDVGIPAAPVVCPPDVITNPAHIARGFFETVDHPLCGPLPYPRPPIMPLPTRTRFLDRPAPLLGEHNTEILSESAGLTEDEIDDLRERGIIGTRPEGL